jgi:DNA-binding transcriptional LysR family regulator
VNLNGQVTTNASLGVQCLALNGMGLAVLPQLIAGPHLKAGTLQRLMADHQLARYEIYAVYRQKQYTPYVQRTFLHWFKSYLVEIDDHRFQGKAD